jgi:hypothetical protein
MEIDLSQIDDLFKGDLRGVNNTSSTKVSIDKESSHNQGITSPRIEGSPKRYLTIEREKQDHERAIEVYKEYQENIKKSEMLRADILKSIKEGLDPYNLLLKTIECISLMTGNPHYYKQGKADIKAIYKALGYKAPAEQEAQEVQERLDNLYKALEKEVDPADKQRITKAIQAHEEKKNYLLKLIS